MSRVDPTVAAARLRVCAGCPRRGGCPLVTARHEAGVDCQHWPAAQEPGLLRRAGRLAREVGRWVVEGAPVVGAEALAAREAACDACEHWDREGYGGLGRCRHPLCGCSGVKRHLATSRCPMGRWPL